jgi:hypothetical protein
VASGLVVMPAGLRGYERDPPDAQRADLGTCVLLSLPELQIHLRSNEYYMGEEEITCGMKVIAHTYAVELSLNQDTIIGSVHPNFPEDLHNAFQLQADAKETIVIDGEYAAMLSLSY